MQSRHRSHRAPVQMLAGRRTTLVIQLMPRVSPTSYAGLIRLLMAEMVRWRIPKMLERGPAMIAGGYNVGMLSDQGRPPPL